MDSDDDLQEPDGKTECSSQLVILAAFAGMPAKSTFLVLKPSKSRSFHYESSVVIRNNYCK